MTNKVIDQLWGYNEKLLELANDINGVKNSIAALQAIIEKKKWRKQRKKLWKSKEKKQRNIDSSKIHLQKIGI